MRRRRSRKRLGGLLEHYCNTLNTGSKRWYLCRDTRASWHAFFSSLLTHVSLFLLM